MISIDGLTVEFGATPLFEDISFVVNKKDRIALVGKNGAGKSTLLKIFAGLQLPTKGRISIPKDTTIGYLPQQMQLQDTRSVLEEASTAFQHIHAMSEEMDKLNQELATRSDYDSEAYQKIIDRVTNLNEQYQMQGGNNFQAEVEKTLLGLGFLRSDFDRPTQEFSGGWRMRIELAKVLLQYPDVLLLDEPTNHLDIESIQWLENFLATRANAVILVSHDRAFIDAVTHRTIEISLGQIHDYKVSYSRYVELRRERREQQLRAYENQQKQIQKTEEFIERFRYKATKSVQVQSRVKQLEKLERVEVDEVDNASLNLKFPPAPHSGAYPVIIDQLTKRYGDHVVLENIELTLERGEKVAFVGKNGEGKSTLVKCIMGEIPFEGSLKIGHGVQIGYFAQNQAQLLDESRTVFETIDYVARGDIRTKIRDILGAFMFGGEASDKKVKVLSGGEKSRLAMIRLLLEPVNLLILDEPTNHLDMRTKDVLKTAIKEFDGTVIVVSHDREFLDGLVTKVYEFGHRKVRQHIGGIFDFLEKKKMDSLQEIEKGSPAATAAKNEEQEVSKGKLSYEARKELSRKMKKVEKEIASLEKEIAEIEEELSSLEQEMLTPQSGTDVRLYEEHGRLKQKMEEWTERTLQLEALQEE